MHTFKLNLINYINNSPVSIFVAFRLNEGCCAFGFESSTLSSAFLGMLVLGEDASLLDEMS